MSARPAPRRRRAFTLVELLVVIAVLGVLAAILIPVVSRVRASAQATHCLANLQQLGRAFTLHAQDHRGCLPAPLDATGGTERPWFVALHPYAAVPWRNDTPVDGQLHPVFLCPTWSAHDHVPHGDDIGYAMSAMLGPTPDAARAVSLTSIQNPTRAIVLLEAPAGSRPFFPAEGDRAAFAAGYAARHGALGCDRHGGAANYLFADGHVGRHSPTEAAVLLER